MFLKMRKIFQVYSTWFSTIKQSMYHFKFSDAKLFYDELTWRVQSIDVIQHQKGYVKYSIDKKIFFWPENFQMNELPWIYNEIFVPFEKNPNSFVHPDLDYSKLEWVIDAGAHEGFFTRLALDAGVKKVIAVEPLEELIDTLCLTFAGEGIHVEKAVLGKDISEINLHVDPGHICEASTFIQEGATESRKVQQITVDHLVKKYGLSGPGLIKADIEGAEMDCLIGAQITLKHLSPFVAIAVYHSQENAEKCAKIIESCNQNYKKEFRGMNAHHKPPRPYMLFGFPQ
jgi:FkbM family methyltransferase